MSDQCSYLCGPHLSRCILIRAHRRDCLCEHVSECVLSRQVEALFWDQSAQTRQADTEVGDE